MKFAEHLTLIETLSYYDRPLIEHWRDTNDQDFLMVWQDENESSVTWYVVPVAPETLAKFLERDLDKAITLREVILTTPFVYRCEANSFVYDLTEGVQILTHKIPDSHMPLDGSYCHLETFAAWEDRENAKRSGEVALKLLDPVPPASPDEAEKVSGDQLIWPELDAEPQKPKDDDDCPWRASNFI